MVLKKKKNEIRKMMSTLNSAFGSLLAQFYFGTFAFFYVNFVNEVVYGTSDRLTIMLCLSHPLFLMGCLYKMAPLGSDIIRICHLTAHRAAVARKLSFIG